MEFINRVPLKNKKKGKPTTWALSNTKKKAKPFYNVHISSLVNRMQVEESTPSLIIGAHHISDSFLR